MDFYKPQLPLTRRPAPADHRKDKSASAGRQQQLVARGNCSEAAEFRSDLLVGFKEGRIITDIWILKIREREKRRVDFAALK